MDNSVYYIHDVFTPSSIAINNFIERKRINDKLVEALLTPGKQLILFGHTGSGKTTLIENKLRQTYEFHITTSCVSTTNFEQLIVDAFDQINPYFTENSKNKITNEYSSNLKAELYCIGTNFGVKTSSENESTLKRILPPQLSPQRLAFLLGQAQACWVIEDFHKIAPAEKKKLGECMKIFMDLSRNFPYLKLIAIGAVETARQVVEYEPEMKNRVSEIYVPLMERSEIEEIIENGLKKLNLSIDSLVKRDIVEYSGGLPSVAHQLCLNLCNALGITKSLSQFENYLIKYPTLNMALTRYLEDESDSIKSLFDKALKTVKKSKINHYYLVLSIISEANYHDGLTKHEILEMIENRIENYPKKYLSRCLINLCSEKRGNLIAKNPTNGRFFYNRPFYKTFARILFKNQGIWPKLFEESTSFQFDYIMYRKLPE
jgi:hypothetical protein